MRPFLTCGLLAAVAAVSAAAETERTQPPATPAKEPPAYASPRQARLASDVAEIVKRFRSRRYKDRQSAEAELLGLHRAYAETLTHFADDADPEVRVRIAEVLNRAIGISRFQHALARLRSADRKKMLRLKKSHPQIVDDILSPVWPRRIKAVGAIEKLDDPEALAEPLLVLCMDHPSKELAAAAIDAAIDNHYRSDAFVDALVATLIRTPQDDWRRSRYSSGSSTGGPLPHMAALSALKSIRPKRAAPALAAMMLDRTGGHNYRPSHLADVLAATGEIRVIPRLIDGLKLTNVYSSWSFGNNKRITLAAADPALKALLLLTNQDATKYGLAHHPHNHYSETVYGFPDAKAREKGVTMFKDWWARNKDKPPYNDMTPLDLPDLTRPEADGRAQQEGR